MRILVLCGDPWHPAQIVQQGLQALENGEFSFEYIEDGDDWTTKRLTDRTLIFLAKPNLNSDSQPAGWMSLAMQAAITLHVRQGAGLLAMHAGTAGYEQTPILRSLLGGVFSHHPEQCSVRVEPKENHPLCTASKPFTLIDEHYFMTLDDPQADVFMLTHSLHGTQPGAWRRLEEAGRVAVLTPGHNLEVWLHPSFQALLRNSLRWCGKLI